MAGEDLLAVARWECVGTPPGVLQGPAALAGLDGWRPASVPGTAAQAAAASGAPDAWSRDYDAEDWWFRARFTTEGAGPLLFRAGGLATVADVWIDGHPILHSENMFRRHEVELPALDGGEHELALRCGALAPRLEERRPRPRWKTGYFANQNLRWWRTTALGRLRGWPVPPAPVGPWRALQLVERPSVRVVSRRLVARVDGGAGTVEASLKLRGPGVGERARLSVGDQSTAVALSDAGEDEATLDAEVTLASVERWWPHTHGAQPRYAVTLDVGAERLAFGAVGFRTLEADTAGDGFALVLNGVRVFCRGAVWLPTDPLAMASPDVRATLWAARGAHLNLVRLAGLAPYEDDPFWDACDELGILVWQDLGLAFADPPADPAFQAELEAELDDNLGAISGRPSVAVICGSQQVEEAAAMSGVGRDRWDVPLLHDTLPKVVDRLLPGVPYLTSNPTGGDPPFRMDQGISHYFGVGAYLRPPEDARRAGVRFAAECMAFATPPDRATVEDAFGGAAPAGHDPAWKRAVHRDAGRSWDLEDVVAAYVSERHAVDLVRLRYVDADRALDLARATVAELFEAVFSEWRRPGSRCDGAVVLALRDLVAGAGWGVLDSTGRPKAPWYALRRVCAPQAVLVTDEGLNGLRAHVVNDVADALVGRVTVELFSNGELAVDRAEHDVRIPPRDALVLDVGSLFDGFRDLTYAFRFSTPQHDVVAVSLLDEAGALVSQAVHLPLGAARPLEPDVGLRAAARPGAVPGAWTLEVGTRRFAQHVWIDVPGFVPDDAWFHLPPGTTRDVGLWPSDAGGGAHAPRGRVCALNSRGTAAVSVSE